MEWKKQLRGVKTDHRQGTRIWGSAAVRHALTQKCEAVPLTPFYVVLQTIDTCNFNLNKNLIMLKKITISEQLSG